jgi:hypothetical protein
MYSLLRTRNRVQLLLLRIRTFFISVIALQFADESMRLRMRVTVGLQGQRAN